MSIESNSKWDAEFLASWSARDASRTVALLAEGATWTDVGAPGPFQDREAIRQYVQSWFTAFPDMTATSKNRVVSEAQVAAEIEFSGTNTGPLQMGAGPAMPPTGEKVNGKGTYFVRFQNGGVVEVHTYADVAGMMMQLGMMGG